MKKLYTKTSLFVLMLAFNLPLVAQDYLIDYTYLGSRSEFELLVLFGQPVDNGVDLYKIRYETPGSNNQPDTASGLLVLPQLPSGTELPAVVYAHGTTNGPTDVPSQLRGGFEVALAYAAFGFITIAPDFLGLGDSRGFHPYVHAATETSASLDMLNGCLEYLEFNAGPDWDPNFLFVAGYSQGGHASMALHREIEDFWSFVYPVSAATHMSGPYSISGVMRDLILSDSSYGSPSYIPYTMLSYQTIYGDIYNEITDIFKEPFATSISNFYEGSINLTVLNNMLIAQLVAIDGDTVNKKMFQDSIITAIETQPNHPINLALADNDTYNWAPTAPTRLYYCGADEQVPYENALVAESTMLGLGALDLKAENLGPNSSHGQCVFPAILSSIDFFKGIINPTSLNDFDPSSTALNVSPNPACDQITIDWENAKYGFAYEIVNTNGQSVTKGHSYLNRLNVEHLTSGVYVIICTAGGETRIARFIHQ